MIPYLISYILSFILPPSPTLSLFATTTTGILFMAHSSTIFVYYAYNKLHRETLLGYLHFKF
jgi:hypothetical protein